MLAKVPKQQQVANANEEVATSNPSPAVGKPAGEVSSGIAVRTLIDLEEEPSAVIDTNLPT